MSSPEVAMEEGTAGESNGPFESYSPPLLHEAAIFLNRDSDLWVFRRFGTLHLFNILSIQQRLTKLERDFQFQNSRFWNGQDAQFEALVLNIQRTLKEYDDALSAQANFRSYGKPETHVLKHMLDWSVNNGDAIREGLDFHKPGSKNIEELASIAATEKTWTHRFIDQHHFLRRLFVTKPSPEAKPQLQPWSTLVYSEENVRRAEAVFLHASFCFLLLCPTITLTYLSSKQWKLGILVLFLLAVSVLSVGFLNAPNKSSLALVAGYAAILVVFLSNNIGS